jgi:hypothetical protein
VISGCGASAAARSPELGKLPLVAGAQIVAQVRSCDRGANGYCALELVVVDPRYRTSDDVLAAEHDALRRQGWTGADGDTGDEHAADSPGHKLRVTYATPYGDLIGSALGFVKRNQGIQVALSRAYFAHSPAMSVMLEVGAG